MLTTKYSIMTENDLSYSIRGAAFKVHSTLGPGLLESVYEAALMYELKKKGLDVRAQVGVPAFYEEVKLDLGFRIDLLVNNKVIIELKSVESLTGVHFKQVQTYLKLTDIKLGLLINFNSLPLRDSIHRIVNNL